MRIRIISFLTLACLSAAQAPSALAQPSVTPPVVAREQLNAVLWSQQAVEYRALSLQTYRQASARLATVKAASLQTASVEQAQAGGFKSKKPGVVLDIDETVLDNGPANARGVMDGRGFDPKAFERWTLAAQATALPGVRAFVDKARALGLQLVFITNRECDKAAGYDNLGRAKVCPQKPATVQNLRAALGYKVADADVLMRHEVQDRDDSDKQARRAEVARRVRIAMLIGDDLNDFIRRADYDAQRHADKWGAQWFALPNATYGSWERGFASVAQKYVALQAWPDSGSAPEGGSAESRLRLLSWNMAWLADPAALQAANFWADCARLGFPNAKLAGHDELPFCDVYKRDGITTAAQYESKKLAALRARLLEMSSEPSVDVLAVQEVQNAAALAAVLPPAFEVRCFTTRPDPQNIGFAVRKGLNLPLTCDEVISLSREDDAEVGRPVRRGLALGVTVQGKTLSILNVHLKSSCPVGRLDSTSNRNCHTLQRQVAPLEAWIEQQAEQGRPFMIVGDWNRDLEAEVAGGFPARSDASDPAGPVNPAVVRNMWPEINDLQPATSAMELVRMDRSASAARACHDILDQMAYSITLKGLLAPGSLSQGTLPARFEKPAAAASDHCPLSTQLVF